MSGIGEMLEVAESYGYARPIEIRELYAIYPECVHFLKSGFYGEQETILEETRKRLLSRLGYQSVQSLKDDLVFGAVMSWSDPANLELNLQIFSDLVISKDGRIDGPSRQKGDPQVVDCFFTNPDITFAATFKNPRYGAGIFPLSFKTLFHAQYGFEPEFVQFGKPNKLNFDYAEEVLREQAERQGIEISKFYMIGDNPSGDIGGGNNKGFDTFLV